MQSTSVLQDVEPETDQRTVEAESVEVELDQVESREQPVPAAPAMVVPVVVPPPVQPEEDDDEIISPQRKMVLDHLLGMAELYARNGHCGRPSSFTSHSWWITRAATRRFRPATG